MPVTFNPEPLDHNDMVITIENPLKVNSKPSERTTDTNYKKLYRHES